MRLVALVEHPHHVCCRYRLRAFQPFLEDAGHRLEVRPFPRSWWEWLSIKHALGPVDALVVQRRLLPAWQVGLLRRAAPWLVFDFDDAVFLRDSYSPRRMKSSRRARRFANILRQADRVIAGNSFLCGQAAYWATESSIHLIPTCNDPSKYPLAKHERSGQGVELVWIGSSSTLQGLEGIRPLLEDVGISWPGVRLKLICDRFMELEHLPTFQCSWLEENEADMIAAGDIGISWLPDDLWSRGKCGLKILQYMAAGLPVVANPVGVQAEMIVHGETGFLARTALEWSTAIGRLAHDPALRARLGKAGRAKVEKEFSVARGAASWAIVVDALRPGMAQAG
ncbi:MAG: glycosyltransferase family 4 protein [Gemmataceae bacterium]